MTEPGNPDTLTESEVSYARTDPIDDADDFVAGHDIGVLRRQVPFGKVQVGAAYPAHANAYPNLPVTRLRVGALAEHEWCARDGSRLVHPPCAHGG